MDSLISAWRSVTSDWKMVDHDGYRDYWLDILPGRIPIQHFGISQSYVW